MSSKYKFKVTKSHKKLFVKPCHKKIHISTRRLKYINLVQKHLEMTVNLVCTRFASSKLKYLYKSLRVTYYIDCSDLFMLSITNKIV